MVNPEFNQNSSTPSAPLYQPPYAAPYTPYAQPAVRPARSFRGHDSIFAWLSIALGFLFMRYVTVYADGFVTTGVFWLLFLFCAVYVRKCGCKPRASHCITGALICVFGTVFSLTASALLHGLCFVFLVTAQVWWVHSVCSGTGFVTRYFPLDLTDSLVEMPFAEFSAAPSAIAASVRKSESAKTVRTVLIGLLITVPLTVIVGILLASADSAVEKIFTTIGKSISDDVIVIAVESALGIPVGFWLFGMLFSGGNRKAHPLRSDETHAENLRALRIIPNVGLYAGVTPICLLYLLYVCTQTTYFLSAFAGKLPDNMIYSDYARRGFFELCAIAVINLLVLLVLNGCAAKGGEKRPKALTIYVTLLCGFTLFIIATALAKMVLYIDAYGLTRLRLYTAWFMLLLAAVFLVLIVRQFKRTFPTAAVLTAVFIGMFGALCFSRPDALITEYNISRYENGTLPELDVPMLCELSDDAYAVLLAHPEAVAGADKTDYFTNKIEERLSDFKYHPDQSWNLSAQILLQTVKE